MPARSGPVMARIVRARQGIDLLAIHHEIRVE